MPFNRFPVRMSGFKSKSGSFYRLSRINSIPNAKKKHLLFFLFIVFIISSCGSNKPYYKTAEGKKKQKYYNDIQFGGMKARGY